jgi:hypothetical protein
VVTKVVLVEVNALGDRRTTLRSGKLVRDEAGAKIPLKAPIPLRTNPHQRPILLLRPKRNRMLKVSNHRQLLRSLNLRRLLGLKAKELRGLQVQPAIDLPRVSKDSVERVRFQTASTECSWLSMAR